MPFLALSLVKSLRMYAHIFVFQYFLGNPDDPQERSPEALFRDLVLEDRRSSVPSESLQISCGAIVGGLHRLRVRLVERQFPRCVRKGAAWPLCGSLRPAMTLATVYNESLIVNLGL